MEFGECGATIQQDKMTGKFLDETVPRNPLQAQQLLRLIFVSAYKQANNDSQ